MLFILNKEEKEVRILEPLDGSQTAIRALYRLGLKIGIIEDISLRPVKYPKHYVRHFKGRIIISTCSDHDVFYKDATWYVY